VPRHYQDLTKNTPANYTENRKPAWPKAAGALHITHTRASDANGPITMAPAESRLTLNLDTIQRGTILTSLDLRHSEA
ncbi:hypothetical protein, partial [Mycobacterium avium]